MARSRTAAAAERRPKGIADPGPLADHLDAIDAGIRELAAVRTRLMNEVQDAFTGLRSSAQLFRQILEQNGIRAMVKNRDAASAQAGGMGPPWAYELWVLRKDLRRARETLDLPEARDG